MDSHYIIKYSGTVELQMLIRIQLWELTSLFLRRIHMLSKNLAKRRNVKTDEYFTSTIIVWYAQ